LNILAIGAHYDDIELGCGGTLAAHANAGDKVISLVLTKSGFDDYQENRVRDSKTAAEEAKTAAEILGISVLRCAELETLDLHLDRTLIEIILRVVEEKKIDIIYTHWIHDAHPDHYITAQATLAASRHVPRLLMYRSNYYPSTAPFNGTFFKNITATIDQKVQAIRAYKSEYDRAGCKWLDHLTKQNEIDGQAVGVKYAECFEIVKYLGA